MKNINRECNIRENREFNKICNEYFNYYGYMLIGKREKNNMFNDYSKKIRNDAKIKIAK